MIKLLTPYVFYCVPFMNNCPFVLVLALCAALCGCNNPQHDTPQSTAQHDSIQNDGIQSHATYQKLSGKTMGTSYHITLALPQGVSAEQIQKRIDERLDAINKSMSTYDDTSTISQFNALKAGQFIKIDADFVKVLNDSRVIYDKSNHAFDPTVYPLVELWGFGAKMSVDRLQHPPSDDDIATAKTLIGLDKVLLEGDNLGKSVDGVGLDFSAIAKGYGVDAIANVLKNEYHIANYMVEIGGEIATLGVNDKGTAWVLAIDKPVMDSTVVNRELMTSVRLSGQGMATSGNYRHALQYNGKRYSHTIDPHTASPVENGAPSVSVIADTTAMADGWATALTALPQDEAIQLAKQNDIKAVFIVQDGDQFSLVKTPAFEGFEQNYPNAISN